MYINEHIQVKGCITQEKYITGKSTFDIERILGFHLGRLSSGYIIAALEFVPDNDEFDLVGYTQVAAHRTPDTTKNLNVNKLKDLLRREKFTVYGNDRLIKVLPNSIHSLSMSDDDQYPPGQGVPQWKLVKPVSAKVVTIING